MKAFYFISFEVKKGQRVNRIVINSIKESSPNPEDTIRFLSIHEFVRNWFIKHGKCQIRGNAFILRRQIDRFYKDLYFHNRESLYNYIGIKRIRRIK